MNKEISNKIRYVIEESERLENLDQSIASRAWVRIISLYRLRFHEGYLIRVESVIDKIIGLIGEVYPKFGNGLRDVFAEILNDENKAREVIGSLYRELNIDFHKPATEEEKIVLDLFLEQPPQSLNSDLKEIVLEFLFEDGDLRQA